MTELDFDVFLRVIADRLQIAEAPLDGSELLLGDLHLDDLEVLGLFVVLDGLRPGFRLPDQFEIEDVRLRDIHHYYLLSCRYPES